MNEPFIVFVTDIKAAHSETFEDIHGKLKAASENKFYHKFPGKTTMLNNMYMSEGTDCKCDHIH
jgi:hypothetical protein